MATRHARPVRAALFFLCLGAAAPVRAELGDVERLRADFEADADRVRLVVLASPT
jgi:hypothetical protein